METRFATMDETYEELFGAVEVPADVQTVLDEIKASMSAYDEEAAIALWNEEFGGVCEEERPEFHTVSPTGRESFCHRHRDEYEEPGDILRTRF